MQNTWFECRTWSARKLRDKLSNFNNLKPLIARDDLIRSVSSTTMTNHSGESVIRKVLSTEIHPKRKRAIESDVIVPSQFLSWAIPSFRDWFCLLTHPSRRSHSNFSHFSRYCRSMVQITYNTTMIITKNELEMHLSEIKNFDDSVKRLRQSARSQCLPPRNCWVIDVQTI
jgi:hypothetical protein